MYLNVYDTCGFNLSKFEDCNFTFKKFTQDFYVRSVRFLCDIFYLSIIHWYVKNKG